jgi:hypothetical protein
MQVLRSIVELLRQRLASRELARARRQEALGQLAEATASYLEAGSRADACRLYQIRADAAADPSERLRLLAQGIAVAPEHQADRLRKRWARLRFEQAQGRLALGQTELLALAEELEALGELTLASEAYAMGGDAEGRIRALIAAGAIERLEQELDAELSEAQAERRRRELIGRIRDLDQQGKRRKALELGRALQTLQPRQDEALAELRAIEQARLIGPRVRLEIDGCETEYVFGDEVIVGRFGTPVELLSPSVSRAHLRIRRSIHGAEVVDLGSRNGTTIGGARLETALLVRSPATLVLGGEVSLQVAPLRAGVRLKAAGIDVCLPLGPLAIGAWRLELGADGWLELCLNGTLATLHGLLISECVELCRGDEICEARAERPRLRVPR